MPVDVSGDRFGQREMKSGHCFAASFGTPVGGKQRYPLAKEEALVAAKMNWHGHDRPPDRPRIDRKSKRVRLPPGSAGLANTIKGEPSTVMRFTMASFWTSALLVILPRHFLA